MRKFLTTALCLLPILALGACQNLPDGPSALVAHSRSSLTPSRTSL